MRTALVGSTGFVGGTLARTRQFTDHYNSSSSVDMAGQHYDEVVFAAARAEKWRINQDPEADARHISELKRVLQSFSADRLILVSTVDVFGSPRGVVENTVVETDGLHPYGLHRYKLEMAAAATHDRTMVVRLPGLFGAGLKKNIIYDLIHGNNVERIDPRGEFQYYNVENLSRDLDRAIASELPLVHLASPPILTGELALRCFGVQLAPIEESIPGRYDMMSLHAEVFGGEGAYAYPRERTLLDIESFVQSEWGNS